MTTSTFQVDQIDHIALTVSDRYQAAQWYNDVLGLTICDEYELWAKRGGPLVISSDGGNTMLALFSGTARGSGPRHIAFRTNGEQFLAFVDQLESISEIDAGGRAEIVDHDLAYSIYFSDPDGHHLELTTYEYDDVAAEL